MARVAIITGSSGLVGSEAVRFYTALGWKVVGIDNNTRAALFGAEASTLENGQRLLETGYTPIARDIRDFDGLAKVFDAHRDAGLVIHAAGQPSHDWATEHPREDFDINAVGTLNVLEAARQYCPAAPFAFLSTNKVYGDWPNRLDMPDGGFDESLPLDKCDHSIFGVSKVAADLMVQEYGRRYGMKTLCLRCGCLTGAAHAGVKLHGYLSYMVRCAMTDTPYTIIGYGGQQVRDNLHAYDVITAIEAFRQNPDEGEFYNLGGGCRNSCTLLKAVAMIQEISGRTMRLHYDPASRYGDHDRWVTDTAKFRSHYPRWRVTRDLESIIKELVNGHVGEAAD